MNNQAKCDHTKVVLRRKYTDTSYTDSWHCDDCEAKFYHLEDIWKQQGKITIMEPHATLRDQFAMAAMLSDAMQSAIIAAAYIAQGKRFDGDVPDLSKTVKEHYETADAMLEARKQP